MITSKENELIRHIKLLNQKKYRDEYNEYFVEGIKQVKEAIQNSVNIKQIIICNEILNEEIEFSKYKVEEVTSRIFEYISDTKTPQGILAIIEKKHEYSKFGNVIFALDEVQDPGNLGTIIRSLDASGLKDLIISNDSVDVYNPKTIRSTMGAIYRVNIILDIELKEKLLQLKNEGYKIVVTSLDTKKSMYNINFDEKCVIVIGNESKGVREDIKEIADYKIKIPMLGKTESLNAAVAASVIMYEYVRKIVTK